MTPEQKAAYVMAMAAQTIAEVAGMQASNAHLVQAGCPPLYTQKDFEMVPIRNGCHHNAVLDLFHNR